MNYLCNILKNRFFDIISLGVSIFAVFFSVCQFNYAREQSISDAKTTEERFNKQFEHLRYNDSIKRINDSIQLQLAIQNYKNSFRPYLSIFKNSSYHTDKYLGIRVDNMGNGLAIIEDIEVRFKGIKNDIDNIPLLLKRNNKQIMVGQYTTFDKGNDDLPLKSGSSQWIFQVPAENITDTMLFQKILLNEVKVTIKYLSLNGETFYVSSN